MCFDRYSALTAVEKNKAIFQWQEKWNRFINDIAQKADSSIVVGWEKESETGFFIDASCTQLTVSVGGIHASVYYKSALICKNW